MSLIHFLLLRRSPQKDFVLKMARFLQRNHPKFQEASDPFRVSLVCRLDLDAEE